MVVYSRFLREIKYYLIILKQGRYAPVFGGEYPPKSMKESKG